VIDGVGLRVYFPILGPPPALLRVSLQADDAIEEGALDRKLPLIGVTGSGARGEEFGPLLKLELFWLLLLVHLALVPSEHLLQQLCLSDSSGEIQQDPPIRLNLGNFLQLLLEKVLIGASTLPFGRRSLFGSFLVYLGIVSHLNLSELGCDLFLSHKVPSYFFFHFLLTFLLQEREFEFGCQQPH